MKQLILAALLGCASLTTTAQETEPFAKPVRIHLNLGAAIPVGDFGSTEYDKFSGFATTGALVSVGVTGELHRNFAVGISYTGRTNAFDNEAYGKAADEETGAENIMDYKPYTSGHFSLDLYGQLPFDKATVYIKASAGYGRLTYGGGTHIFSNGSTSTTAKFQEVTSSSPIYGLGAGYRYEFGRFGAGVELAYMLAKKEVEAFDDTFIKPYSSLNITAGLSYRIFNLSSL